MKVVPSRDLALAEPRDTLVKTLQGNWQAEMEDSATYLSLAAKERNSRRRNVLRGLAAIESYHAKLWAKRIRELGGEQSSHTGPLAGSAEAFTSLSGGIDLALRRLKIDERRTIGNYKAQVVDQLDQATLALLTEVLADENEHYKILSSLIRARPPLPKMEPRQARAALAKLLKARRGRHPEAAGWLNDAIYAMNDGLGSIFGIVSGVAGATFGKSHFVLIAGLAGVIGTALSAGTGAYLSAKSEREIFEAGIVRERRAVEYNHAEALEVLALNYQIRGLPEDVASRLVHLLAENKEELVKALARTRANTSEEALSNPWMSGLTGSTATALGAFVPIVPFFFMSGLPAILTAAGVSLLAHFGVGAARSMMTVRSWWSSGIELALFGAVEGVVTFFSGVAVGSVVGIC